MYESQMDFHQDLTSMLSLLSPFLYCKYVTSFILRRLTTHAHSVNYVPLSLHIETSFFASSHTYNTYLCSITTTFPLHIVFKIVILENCIIRNSRRSSRNSNPHSINSNTTSK